MRAIGYVRLSKKNEKSVSVEYQAEAIQRLALSQNYELVSIEVDYGISGKRIENRPAVNRVIQAVADKRVDAILVYNSDRLSRNGIEGLQLRKQFDEAGIAYWSYTEGKLSYDLLAFVREGVNREERKKISMRTKQAIEKKRSKGERVGSQLPYGKAVVLGHVVMVPEEQMIIRRINELRNQGMSSYRITDEINSEGFRTRKQTKFHKTQILRIMKQAA